MTFFLGFSQKSAEFENDNRTSWLRRNSERILDDSVCRKQRFTSKQRESTNYYWVSFRQLKSLHQHLEHARINACILQLFI